MVPGTFGPVRTTSSSVKHSGFPFTVSVPDGAPPARDGQGNLVPVPEGADDVEPEHDEKYRYISNNWPRLEKVKRFILATARLPSSMSTPVAAYDVSIAPGARHPMSRRTCMLGNVTPSMPR